MFWRNKMIANNWSAAFKQMFNEAAQLDISSLCGIS